MPENFLVLIHLLNMKDISSINSFSNQEKNIVRSLVISREFIKYQQFNLN